MVSIYKLVMPVTTAMLLITAGTGEAIEMKTSPMIAHLDVEPANYTEHTGIVIADLLRSKSDTVVKPFEQLLNRLVRSDKSNCDLEVEVRLVTVCRSLDGNAVEDPETVQSLEAVRSLYGIRKALCETGIPGTQIPASCRKLLPVTTSDMSQKQLAKVELRIASSDDVQACLQKFQEHHYFWTSYSNNRQEANQIYNLLRSDIELYAMVLNYRDFQSVVDDFGESMSMMHEQTNEWFNQAFQQAQVLFDSHGTALAEFDAHLKNLSTDMVQDLWSAGALITDLQAYLSDLLSKTSSDLSSIDNEIETISQGMRRMKDSMTEIYRDAAVEVAVFARSESNKLVEVFDMIELRSSLFAELINDMQFNAIEVANTIESAVGLSDKQMLLLQHQHDLASSTFDKQNATIELVEAIQGFMEQLTSDTHGWGTTVSAIVDLIDLVKRFEYVVVVLCAYVVLTVILNPLETTLVPHRFVTQIKRAYWAFSGVIFLFHELGLRAKLSGAVRLSKWIIAFLIQSVVFWFTISFIVGAGLVVVGLHFLRPKKSIMGRVDVEKAECDHKEKICYTKLVCNDHKQRMESLPRNARHGTTPPGL